MAKNLVFHAWTKHIEVHYHFIREKVLAGEIDLVYVSTQGIRMLTFLPRPWELRSFVNFMICLE